MNEQLASIECVACGCAEAAIKRRKNGKRLLYIHCPKCGTDQRSGAKLQADLERRVSAALKGETPPTAANDEPTPAPMVAEIAELEEWQPEQIETAPAANDEPNPAKTQPIKSKSTPNLKRNFAIGGALALCALLARKAIA